MQDEGVSPKEGIDFSRQTGHQMKLSGQSNCPAARLLIEASVWNRGGDGHACF